MNILPSTGQMIAGQGDGMYSARAAISTIPTTSSKPTRRFIRIGRWPIAIRASPVPRSHSPLLSPRIPRIVATEMKRKKGNR